MPFEEEGGLELERGLSIAETYTAWANGECYNFVLFDSTGCELSSCWGFIGRGAAEAARHAASDAAEAPP